MKIILILTLIQHVGLEDPNDKEGPQARKGKS